MTRLGSFSKYGVDMLTVLAGGEGTRLLPISNVIYKGLIDIKRNSLLIQNLLRAYLFGATRVLVLTDRNDPLMNYLIAEQTEENLSILMKRMPDSSILQKVESLFSMPDSNRFCLCYGDTYADVDFDTLFKQHIDRNLPATITVTQYQIPYGVVSARSGLVESFCEKPETNFLVSIGYFVFEKHRKVMRLIKKAHSFEQFLQTLAVDGLLSVYLHKGHYEALNEFDDLYKT